MAVAQLTKPVVATWAPNFIGANKTRAASATFHKKMVAFVLSTVLYKRNLLPEAAFKRKAIEDMEVKILSDKSQCPKGVRIARLIKGCFDAIEKRYLQRILMGIYNDPENPDEVIEGYSISFNYVDKYADIQCYQPKDQMISRINLPTIKAAEMTKKEAKKLIRNIVITTAGLEDIAADSHITIKLLYYDEVTPPDYEPPGFKPGVNPDLKFLGTALNLDLGSVATKFQSMKVRAIIDKSVFETAETVAADEYTPVNSQIEKSNPQIQILEEENQDDIVIIEDAQKENIIGERCVNTVGRNGMSRPTLTQQCSKEDAAMEKERKLWMKIRVQCPCGTDVRDDIMLTCSACESLQHGTCFSILAKDEIPPRHFCIPCSDKLSRPQTDPVLAKHDCFTKMALCLWKRALVLVSTVPHFDLDWFKESLQITSSEVLNAIIMKMKNEGCIQDIPRRSNHYFVNGDGIQRCIMWYISHSNPDNQSPRSKDNEPEAINNITKETKAMSLVEIEEVECVPRKRKVSDAFKSPGGSRLPSQNSLAEFQKPKRIKKLTLNKTRKNQTQGYEE